MKKIPCLFVRIFRGHDSAIITDDVTPGCEWVLAGEGTASRKWDGSACMVKGGALYKRLDCKRGKIPPPNAIPCQEPDAVTGHWPHWIKVESSDPSSKWFTEAWESTVLRHGVPPDGTYELIGPKVGGNAEHVLAHAFRKHGDIRIEVERSFAAIRSYLEAMHIEGVVFAHDDGRMCKIRRDDFGFDWPVSQ